MRNQRGQALVETAIILPLLLLLIFALCDYARYMYTKNTLNNAARAGARAAAVDRSLTATGESGSLFNADGTAITPATSTMAVLQQNIFNGIKKDDSVTYALKVTDDLGQEITGTVRPGHVVQVSVRWSSFEMVTPMYKLRSWWTGGSTDDPLSGTIYGTAAMRYE